MNLPNGVQGYRTIPIVLNGLNARIQECGSTEKPVVQGSVRIALHNIGASTAMVFLLLLRGMFCATD